MSVIALFVWVLSFLLAAIFNIRLWRLKVKNEQSGDLLQLKIVAGFALGLTTIAAVLFALFSSSVDNQGLFLFWSLLGASVVVSQLILNITFPPREFREPEYEETRIVLFVSDDPDKNLQITKGRIYSSKFED